MERIFFLALCWLAGCGGTERQTGDLVARIGDQVISAAAYEDMAGRLLAGPYSELDPAAPGTREQLLEAMIAKHLLLEEGRRRQLDRDPHILGQVVELEEKHLYKALFDQVAPALETVDETELKIFFYESGFDEELRLRQALFASDEEARKALEELRRGASLEDMAKERSLHVTSRQRGGDLGYMPAAHMLSEIGEELLSLEVGQIYPEPLHTRYGVHVFQLLDRRPADFEARRQQVRIEYESHVRRQRFAAYVDSLKQAWDFACDAEKVAAGAGSAEDGKVLCQWQGGAFRAADFGGWEEAAGEDLSRAVEEAASRALALDQARRLGYQSRPEISDRVRQLTEQLVVERLQREVVGQVQIGEQEMRAFYEAHPELYGPRPAARVLEILVEEREEAEALRRRVEAGESMEELSGHYNQREATRDKGGYMWVAMRDNPLLGPLAPLALDAEPGTLHGPLAVPGGFSLFLVVERSELPASSFEEVSRNIGALLRIRGENERMDRFLSELRQRRAGAVEIFPEALAATLKEHAGDGAAAAGAGSASPQ